jgi:hypothetical protein
MDRGGRDEIDEMIVTRRILLAVRAIGQLTGVFADAGR